MDGVVGIDAAENDGVGHAESARARVLSKVPGAAVGLRACFRRVRRLAA